MQHLIEEEEVYILETNKVFLDNMSEGAAVDLILNNFYDPSARQILLNWIDWSENQFSETSYQKILQFINEEHIVISIISNVIAHIIKNAKTFRYQDTSFTVFKHTIKTKKLITDEIEYRMKEEGYL